MWRVRGSGSRSARTCGFPGRRPPSSRRRARSSSSTSRPRRSTSARAAGARGHLLGAGARERRASSRSATSVGGQDELIFDGHSLVLGSDGSVLARAAGFEEALLVVDLERPEAAPIAPFDDDLEQMRRALVLGLRDYVAKNGFDAVIVSVSGGIDSAVTAALAVEALGADRVHCVSMPSRYSSAETRADARRLAENLGCDFRELPIEPVVEAYTGVLAESFAGREPDATEENLQARIRGTLADGAVEQVRLAGRRDRQQVGAGGRLRDAVRRHGRRLRAPQGRVQDGRLPARAAPERAGWARARPPVDDRPCAERRAARGPAATRTRCRRTPSSIGCSRPTSRTTARSRS